jgi:hypothetical protein
MILTRRVPLPQGSDMTKAKTTLKTNIRAGSAVSGGQTSKGGLSNTHETNPTSPPGGPRSLI